MWLFLLVGLFCLLLVIGAIFHKEPLRFAVSGIVVLAALAFVVILGVVVWALLNIH